MIRFYTILSPPSYILRSDVETNLRLLQLALQRFDGIVQIFNLEPTCLKFCVESPNVHLVARNAAVIFLLGLFEVLRQSLMKITCYHFANKNHANFCTKKKSISCLYAYLVVLKNAYLQTMSPITYLLINIVLGRFRASSESLFIMGLCSTLIRIPHCIIKQ